METQMTLDLDFPPVVTMESFDRLRELAERKQRMLEAVRALPAQIEAAHADALALREQLVQVDIDFEASPAAGLEDSAGAHKAKTDAIMEALLRAEAAERRLIDRQSAMLPAISGIDDELSGEVANVHADADSVLEALTMAMEPEVERVAAELGALLAKAEFIRKVWPRGSCGNYLKDSYVPVASNSIEFDPALRDYRPRNRLLVSDAQRAAARAELGPQLEPVIEALQLANRFTRYSHNVAKIEEALHKGAPNGVVLEYTPPHLAVRTRPARFSYASVGRIDPRNSGHSSYRPARGEDGRVRSTCGRRSGCSDGL